MRTFVCCVMSFNFVLNSWIWVHLFFFINSFFSVEIVDWFMRRLNRFVLFRHFDLLSELGAYSSIMMMVISLLFLLLVIIFLQEIK
uniref:Uncharacterized protein n=1 Tax=Cannabis sativa TaxID=3483 RepID=A0A803QVP5_CANSA